MLGLNSLIIEAEGLTISAEIGLCGNKDAVRDVCFKNIPLPGFFTILNYISTWLPIWEYRFNKQKLATRFLLCNFHELGSFYYRDKEGATKRL